MIVLEGNTSSHRLALQTAGELQQLQARIAEVKDIELPESFNNTKIADNSEAMIPLDENVVLSYLFQAVMIDDKVYLVPDLDNIAYQLIDLDS
ncbi:Uncharacterised protein [Streptococcus pneumoniae]|nr:Uncharacterised protein [Streptococcus pneumoniae]